MKVLIVNTLFPPHRIGGAEKSVALLADGLARKGDTVVVATLDDIAAPATERLASGVIVKRLPMDNIYWPYAADGPRRSAVQRLIWHFRNRWNTRAARRIGALIDAERPDVIHCNVLTGFSNAVWVEAKKRGVPIVQTLRDYAVLCTRAALFKNGHTCTTRCAECRVLTAPAKPASRLVDELVSISHFVAETHRGFGYFDDVPSRRIFNIIPPAPADAAMPRSGPLTFGYIGRVEAEKGIEVVLDACARLQRDDWRLLVAGVGEPGYVADLRARHADPRIEWLGFVDSRDFYRAADVVLISSVWPEPLTRTLIEAASHGRSVICAAAGGIPEIADLPRLSALYPPTDSAALASRMTTAIDQREDWRAGGIGNQALLDCFSEEAVVAAYRQVYADAIARVASATRAAA